MSTTKMFPARPRWGMASILGGIFLPVYALLFMAVLAPLVGSGLVFKALGRLSIVQRLITAIRPLWDRPVLFLGRLVLKDERAAPIVPYMLLPLLWIPMIVALAIDFRPWLACLYLMAVFGPNMRFYAAYTAISHHTAHIPNFLFKPPLEKFQFYFVEYFLGPFHGTIPGSFPISHVRMHHACDNNEEDPSSTLYFRRDSIIDFIGYMIGPAMLYISGISALVFFHRNKRTRSFRQMAFGLGVYLAVFALLLVVKWQLALVCMMFPFFLNVIGFSVVNWAEHGFADPLDYNNVDTNTSTIVGPQLPLNENHHYAHHVKPANQWTRDPDFFQAQLERLSNADPPVFTGLDWADIWRMMVTRQYTALARYYVIVNKDRRPEEVPSLLRERMQRNLTAPVLVEEVEEIRRAG